MYWATRLRSDSIAVNPASQREMEECLQTADGLLMIHPAYEPAKHPDYRANLAYFVNRCAAEQKPVFVVAWNNMFPRRTVNCYDSYFNSLFKNAIPMTEFAGSPGKIDENAVMMTDQMQVNFIAGTVEKQPRDVILAVGGTRAEDCVWCYSKRWFDDVDTKYRGIDTNTVSNPLKRAQVLDSLV